MKKGISLILIIIMVLILIILGFVCAISISNSSSSFLHISECKKLQSDVQEQIDSLIYKYRSHLGNSLSIKEGYLYTKSYGGDLPKIYNNVDQYDIYLTSLNSLAGGELANADVYLDSFGIVHVKYLFFKF